MTKDEKSLLLYLEARAVDHGGLVDARLMNAVDFEIAKRWNEEGFISFGRILFDLIPPSKCTNYVRLSDEAWEVVHVLRRLRAFNGMHELAQSNGGRDEVAA